MKSAIAWQIHSSGKPRRLKSGAIDLEKDLEDWVDADVDIVADDVLVIGRQVSTSWGTVLDLLGIDTEGNLVIIELKRHQTLRETIAQGLEYAAWASKLSYDDVVTLASSRFQDEDGLKGAFAARFKAELPSTLNELQRVLIVAPTIDDTTDTVVRYLAETYRLPINAVSFDVFGDPGDQVLVRHFVREQSDIPAPSTTKKKPSRTMDEFLARSTENGVREIADELLTLRDLFPQTVAYHLAFNLRARTPDHRWLTGVSVSPTAESTVNAVELAVGVDNLVAVFGIAPSAAKALAQEMKTVATPLAYNWEGWFKVLLEHPEQASTFCARLRALLAPAAGASAASDSLASAASDDEGR